MDIVAEDGIAFRVTHGAPSSTAAREQSWDEAAELDQDVVAKVGNAFLVTRRSSSTAAALEQSWDEAVDGQLPLQ